jgi:oligopeptide transport system ATP-binding protein
MYGGRMVETASARNLYAHPAHPYTRGLMASVPRIDGDPGQRLTPIDGQPPDLASLAPGCAFKPRCQLATQQCGITRPLLRSVGDNHYKACFIND